ncbi:hypothetical protein [Siphonobacter aquaeclarae]|jgi:hypothetical protein|uniref:hypothetical protein n=1 Tax=Siphonobacter aquaeclarae TaxID=563176 RepID=UPI001B0958A0|nr:hypothetical protein [Siphonobacter aquaeclarae]MBO9641318.1 hypothetical protein [Siphonobacter aquaeclarae]
MESEVSMDEEGGEIGPKVQSPALKQTAPFEKSKESINFHGQTQKSVPLQQKVVASLQ